MTKLEINYVITKKYISASLVLHENLEVLRIIAIFATEFETYCGNSFVSFIEWPTLTDRIKLAVIGVLIVTS